MADVVADRVILELEAKLDKFRADIRSGQQEFRDQMRQMQANAGDAERRVNESFGRVGDFFKNVLRGLVTEEAFRRIGEAAAEAINQIAEIGEIAGRIGITTQALQALDRQAVLTGASTEEMHRALQNIALQTVQPNSFIQRLFNANNVRISADMNENIEHFLDLVKNASSASERLSIVTEAGGGIRFARQLVQAFSGGADVIKSTFAELEKEGRAHSDAQIEEMQKIRDKYREYMDDIRLTWQNVVVGLIEATGAFSDKVDERTQNLQDRLRLVQELQALQRRAAELRANPNSGSAMEDLGLGIGVGGGVAQKLELIDRMIREHIARIRELGAARLTLESSVNREAKGDFLGVKTGGPAATVPPEDPRIVAERKALQKAIEDTILTTEREIEKLRDEAEATGKSAYEVARLRKEKELMQQIDDAHREHGGYATPEEIARVKELADSYGQLSQTLVDHENQLKSLKDATDTVFSDMESSIDKFIDTGKFSFRDLVSSILKDMAKLGVHNLFQMAEGGTPGQSGGGLLGLFSSMLGLGTAPTVAQPIAVMQNAQVAGASLAAGAAPAVQQATGWGQKLLPWLGNVIPGFPRGVGAPKTPFESAAPEAVTGGALIGATGTGGITGGGVQQQMWDFFTSKGMKPADVAAIMGNVKGESGFDPGAKGKAGELGLFQFLGSRKQGVIDRYGPNPTANQQMEYAWHEMQTSEAGPYGRMLNAPTLQAKTGAFTGFERPGWFDANHPTVGGNAADRFAGAQEAMKNFSAKVPVALDNVTSAAEKSATGFSNTFPQALQTVVGAVGGAGGGGGGLSGIFDFFSSTWGGGKAGGGEVAPGKMYRVGEFGHDEMFVPKTRGDIVPLRTPIAASAFPSTSRVGGQNVEVTVRAHPTKYLFAETDMRAGRIADAGDGRVIDQSRKSYPNVASTYSKLGTTSR